MGKKKQLTVEQEQQQEVEGRGCILTTTTRRIEREISVKCVVVLIFGLCVLLPALFWVFPHRTVSVVLSRYDASHDIKLKATVQAIFRLQKPVPVLVPEIYKLEHDITDKISVPFIKIVILSMHQAGTDNETNVIFGILPNPIDSTINPVSLSLLRSSFIDLFLQQSNLTLTATIFGEPSSFEIVKFPGGITVLPEQTAFISEITQNYFKFLLNNSVCDVKQHLILFKEEMKTWLHLRRDENVFVQVTNNNGSTTEHLVMVKARVISDTGLILPQRLQQLAQRITEAPSSTNLGLNNTLFAPSPDEDDDNTPYYPPVPSPSDYHSPCDSTISSSPSPSNAPSSPFLGVSPSPIALPLISPSTSSSGGGVFLDRICKCFNGLLTFSLLLLW